MTFGAAEAGVVTYEALPGRVVFGVGALDRPAGMVELHALVGAAHAGLPPAEATAASSPSAGVPSRR